MNNTRSIYHFLVIVLLTITVSIPGNAKDFGIVAVVNDQAISTEDVKGRIQLALFASGLTDSPEVRAKLRPQIIQVLIDESLYRQKAEELNIKANEEEINTTYFNLEKRNNVKPGKLKNFMRKNGVPFNALKQQVESEILWSKIINRHVKPEVIVTNAQIDETIEYISRSSGGGDIHLAKIELPIDSNNDEEQVTELAQELIEQIESGARFDAIAQQFSRDISAKSGGDKGWIPVNQLSMDVREHISQVPTGGISTPLRLADSIAIYKVIDRRTIIQADSSEDKYSIKQAFFDLPSNLPSAERIQIENTIELARQKVKSCKGFDEFATKHGSSSSEIMNMQLKDFNPQIAHLVAQTKAGRATSPLKNEEGLFVLMICSKSKAKGQITDYNAIEEQLKKHQLSLHIQRYLQKLRKEAYIDKREL